LQQNHLRGQEAASDEGQREFVVWWLLCGHQLHDRDFVATPEQLAVAMESIPGRAGPVPRLLRRVHRESSDLRRLFDLDTPGGRAGYLAWFMISGHGALKRPSKPARARSAQSVGVRTRKAGIGASSLEIGSQIQARLPPGTDLFAQGVFGINPPAQRPDESTTGRLVPKRGRRLARERAPFGVNLVGFAFGELGLGEDLRMMSLALDAAGVAHVAVDVPASPHTRARDRSVAQRVVDRLRYPITVFCLNPFDMAGLYAGGREDLFQAEHTIGYWPWELPQMPPFWRDAYRLVDEVWAPSRYTAAAFQETSPVPVHVMPPCVAIPDIARVRAKARKLRAERGGRFRFIFPFDRKSYLTRKNPFAVVAAFRQAFGPDDHSVELLLRINGERGNDADVARLRAEARSDRRIVLHEGTLPRAEALALLASADCLVSPHRAEGFGRNIAEAILLGVPVLATRFGGCIDFLASDEGIDWRPVAIGEGEYAHATGQWWAEPDLDHLARRMAELPELRREASRTDSVRATEFQAVYSPTMTGARYVAALQKIHNRLFGDAAGKVRAIERRAI
jgi:glycosyltransferase involved in cell wall biosynthesis